MTTSTEAVGGLLSQVEDFEAVYSNADGDPSCIPWAKNRPDPALVNWLNNVAPSLIRSGARVMVIGCGLGNDAQALIHRGYDVTAFDCSETAVNWARRLDPSNHQCYHVADLFDLPLRWRHRFDLVVEIKTLQSILPERRHEAMLSIAKLLSRHGQLLIVCKGIDAGQSLEDGPPWPLSRDDLLQAASSADLVMSGDIAEFLDDDQPPVHRIRALFKRG
ncbi:MAG: class I SAM-dependent methyltransferase [Planctomycetes bacterium]|nr:class I SAM-dependent methyltransferase [Planctomycetota bacterium]MCH7601826.1 class I SAM-dependent methyltransferase [Planctomycetota bacterium]